MGNDMQTSSSSSAVRAFTLVVAALVLLFGAGLVLMRSGNAETPAAALAQAGIGAEQKTAIEAIVKGYLLEHPEVLLEMQTALESKMAKEEAERTRAMVAQHGREIYRAENAAVAGNPNGDITVVEFFDYNCGYCKRGFSEIAKLVEKDKNVRVVFKEFPILRDESEQASKVALAARRQGKYWELHSELITTKGLVNEAVALKAAEKLGLDMAKLKTDMASPEVKAELDGVKELAKKLSIQGTPHFLVGDRAVGGAPENLYDVLEGHVADLRKTGCNYC